MRILPESFQGTPIWSASRDLPSQSLVSIPMSKKHDRQSSNQHLGQVNPSEWVLPTTHWKVFRRVLTMSLLDQMQHWRWSWIEPWCGEIGAPSPSNPLCKEIWGQDLEKSHRITCGRFPYYTSILLIWLPRIPYSTSILLITQASSFLSFPPLGPIWSSPVPTAHGCPFGPGQWGALVDVGSYHKNSNNFFQQKHHHQYQQQQQQQQYLLMMMSTGWLAIGLRLPAQWVGDLMKTEQGIVGIQRIIPMHILGSGAGVKILDF